MTRIGHKYKHTKLKTQPKKKGGGGEDFLKTKVMYKAHIFSTATTTATPKKLHKLLPWAFYSTLALVIFRLYFYPHSLHNSNPIIVSPSFISPTKLDAEVGECEYSNGKWVHDKWGPLYNGSTCGTIKEGQNCIAHGRPDMGYLYWRWRPKQCKLPRFEPSIFLQLFSGKHLAFVGDSMARNQLESLLCMLATVSVPELVYREGEDNKFKRWHFGSHNVTVSVYWSPFLVKGVEKSKTGPNHNELFLDSVDGRWAADLGSIDMVLLSIGHWFLHPAVYYEGGTVLGCHYCPGLNFTEIGFYDVLRKALRTTLGIVIEKGEAKVNGIDVVLTTFSPAHFEGEWDKFGACPKTNPYGNKEKAFEGMDKEIRDIEINEVEAAQAKIKVNQIMSKVRLEALDVTELSLMRPDSHPGPYMHPFPFENGVTDRVQNDCVHWCLPGAIDTWNEILLEVIKRWRGTSNI